MLRSLLLLPIFLLFFGCGSDSSQRPYIAGEKPKSVARYTSRTDPTVKVAIIEAESRKEVAQIQMQRDVELEQIKKASKTEELSTHKEIAIKEHEALDKREENLNSRYNSIVIIGALFLLTAMGLLVYFLLKRREDNLKMHQDNIEKEMALQEKELQVKMATKILDTIASGNLDKEEERRLIETFEKSNKALPYKKKF